VRQAEAGRRAASAAALAGGFAPTTLPPGRCALATPHAADSVAYGCLHTEGIDRSDAVPGDGQAPVAEKFSTATAIDGYLAHVEAVAAYAG